MESWFAATRGDIALEDVREWRGSAASENEAAFERFKAEEYSRMR
jgi:hypothetical protein